MLMLSPPLTTCHTIYIGASVSRCVVRPARSLKAVAVKAHLAAKVPTHDGRLNATGMRTAIIVGRFNDLVTKLLLEGCISALDK